MAVAMPVGPSSGARSDVRLLDPAAVHVHLGQRTSITIGAERPELDIPGGDEGLEPSLCSVTAGLIQLGRVDVGQPHFAVIANQRVAVNRETALACRCSQGKQNADDEDAGHAAITR